MVLSSRTKVSATWVQDVLTHLLSVLAMRHRSHQAAYPIETPLKWRALREQNSAKHLLQKLRLAIESA